MADGITPAYDAFSQRRDTGTQERVTERRRVDTYTDPNRYQMPPNRRLFVQANPVDVTVTPSDGMLDKLAEGLAKVKPQLMNYFANKEIERNKASIQEGIKEAMATEAARAGDKQFFDDQWKEYGYNKQTSFMNGESLGKQLEIDSANRDLNTSWDEWYNEWWFNKQLNNETPKTADFLEEWNRAYEPYSRKAKTADLVRIDTAETTKRKNTTQQYINETVDEANKKGTFNIDTWHTIKQDVQLTSHWSNQEMDEFFFNTVARLVQDDHFAKNGFKDLKIFREPRRDFITGEKIPPLYANKDYQKQIEALENEVRKKHDDRMKALEKQDKEDTTFSDKLDRENESYLARLTGYNSFSGGALGAKESDTAAAYDVAVQNKYSEIKRNLLRTKYLGDGQAGIQAASDEARDKAEEWAYANKLVNKGWIKAQQKLLDIETNTNKQIINLNSANNPDGNKILIEYYRNNTDLPFAITPEQAPKAKALGKHLYLKSLMAAKKNETKDANKLNEAATKAKTESDRIENQLKQ